MALCLLKKGIFFRHVQSGVISKVCKAILNGTRDHIFWWTGDCIFSWFLWPCIYEERFPNSNSENIVALFAKNLIKTLFTHYSLFLNNILDSANKTFIGETVTFCSSHYSLIGFWYSGNMYVRPTVHFRWYKTHIKFIIFHGLCCTYQEAQLEQCTTEETKFDL